MDKQSTFVFLTYYATEFYYVTRSLHVNMAKELEITKKFRKNSRDMSCYSSLEICIEVERKRHKALRKKIQGIYFEICALYFKIYALFFCGFQLFEKHSFILKVKWRLKNMLTCSSKIKEGQRSFIITA